VWGADAVNRFDGIFAFAVWDSIERTLFLARDHLGVKPLLYAERDGLIVFGSELKAVAAHPAVGDDLDGTALSDYLSL